MKNVKFVMLGGGPLEAKLKELARALKVYKNMDFVGYVPEREMPAYLASVDMYVDSVCDYRPDGLGNVIVARGGGGVGQTTRQAMSCGTPCLLSNTIGIRANDYFCGLLYKQLDHKDMAEQIIYLLSNMKLRQKISEKSRNVALKVFDMEKTMKRWEIVYRKLND